MSEHILSTSSVALPVPSPRTPLTVRPATPDDLPFIDGLQKLHTKQVGWMPTQQLEGKIARGHVIVAEERGTADYADDADKRLNSHLSVPSASSAVKSLGYCIAHDQYFKRDDVGIIYQVNVLPGHQRGFIGAALLKAQFERSAYGCKLYCCWCVQDIQANRFWEAMGFVPLAFRTGSSSRQRIHIFWQRRIRQGDDTTPYWFPSQTDAGSLREDRIVLPIPPGVHWSDDMPVILPGSTGFQPVALPAKHGQDARGTKKRTPVETPTAFRRNGLLFDIPKQGAPVTKEKPKRGPEQKAPRVKPKNNPRLVAAARELRDRWLEQVNAGEYLPAAQGKYDVSRMPAIARPDDAPLLMEQAA